MDKIVIVKVTRPKMQLCLSRSILLLSLRLLLLLSIIYLLYMIL